MKRKVFMALLSFLLACSIVACTKGETTTVALRDDLVVMGYMRAASLDPNAVGSCDKMVNTQIFDSLVRVSDDGTITEGIATDWVLESDGLTYTITIRDDVVFHDGTAMTADDIIFSLDAMLAQQMNAWMKSYFTSHTKINETTIQIVKKTPFAKIMNIIADRLFIVPQDLYENDHETFLAHPIGTGAYMFVSQAEDKSVTLIKNEEYFLGEPAITNVRILAPVEASAAVIKLETGEVDLIFAIPTSQKAIVADNDDFVYVETQGWAMNQLVLLGEKLTDINLRKAISYAINPGNAILVANEGIGTVPTNLYSDRIMGDLAGEVTILGYNATQALYFFNMSNYTDDLDIVLTVEASQTAIAQSIQSDLAAIGIDITIEQVERSVLFQKLSNGELDLTIREMGTIMNGVEEMISIPIMPPFSLSMSPTAARVSLIQLVRGETDPEIRANLCIQAMQYAVNEVDTVPLFEPVSSMAYTKGLSGISTISAATFIFYIGNFRFSTE